MINAKPFQLTEREKQMAIQSAKTSVQMYDRPFALFFDSSGGLRIEKWSGHNYTGGLVCVVLPKWVEIAA